MFGLNNSTYGGLKRNLFFISAKVLSCQNFFSFTCGSVKIFGMFIPAIYFLFVVKRATGPPHSQIERLWSSPYLQVPWNPTSALYMPVSFKMFSMLLHNVMWPNNSTYRPTGNDAINEYVLYVADNYGNEAIVSFDGYSDRSMSTKFAGSVVAQVAKCSTVGSWRRSVNVAFIPSLLDAGGWGCPPRFRTLVTGAHKAMCAALVFFPHFRRYTRRLRTCRSSLSLSQ